MLEYYRTDVSGEIDGNKANSSRKCIICHYWYFVEIDEIRFKQNVFDGCHNLTQKALSFINAAIVSIKGNDYSIHFW